MTTDCRAYNAFVESARIDELRLVKLTSSVSVDVAEGENLKVEVLPKYRRSLPASSGQLHCDIRFELRIRRTDADEEAAPVLSLDAEYHARYSTAEGEEPSDDIADLFVQRNGVFNAWPFFRELAFNISTRSGVGPVLTPLFKLPYQLGRGDSEK